MPEIIGIDHVYISVSGLESSGKFYDAVMEILGFRKSRFQIGVEEHIQYYNRHFSVVLRPARVMNQHEPYAPGLHHLCLRVESEKEVQEAASMLTARSISVSEPRYFPEYAPDYFAVFLSDPDGIRLEITNYRRERRQRHDHWENSNP
jgi:catechol-2,3-dioxygenase